MQNAQTIESTYQLYCNSNGKRRLSASFQPDCFDVTCARGKVAHNSEGNRRFRALVQLHQADYKSCTCKYEKSKIVSHIVQTVRQAASSHKGGFVKQVDGVWYEVGDRAAKEKIGQTFRDLLHTKYSSSTKAKARARIQRRMDEEYPEEEEQTVISAPASPLHLPQIFQRFSLVNSQHRRVSSVKQTGAFTDQRLLETLRSSIQTVEHQDLMRDSLLSMSPAMDEIVGFDVQPAPYETLSSSIASNTSAMDMEGLMESLGMIVEL